MHKPTDHIRVRAKHGILRDAPQGGSGIESAASFGSEHQKILRAAHWWNFPSFPASAGPILNKKVRRRSGIVPERALEANTKKSRAQRIGGTSRASLRAQSRSRGAPQRQPTSLMSRCQSLPSLTRTAEPSCRYVIFEMSTDGGMTFTITSPLTTDTTRVLCSGRRMN